MHRRISLGPWVWTACWLVALTGCTPKPDRPTNTTASGTTSSSDELVVDDVVAVTTSTFDSPATQPPAQPTAASTGGQDWTYWRGPSYDGISLETGLPDEWDPAGGEGSNVLWKNEELGGRSTPIVMNGKLYCLVRAEPGTPREGERVVCVDAATGQLLWENRFNVWLSDVPDTRVGWSSVVGDPDTGRVYALGVCGFFQCLDGQTGQRLWSVPLHERFGLLSTYGGRTNFPIICEDLVIISGVVIGWGDDAKPAHRLIGFDKSNGQVVWMNGTRLLPDDTTYSAPSLVVINGQKALVFGSGDGAVWAFQPRTGVPIWNYDLSLRGLNVAPLVVGDRVYMGQSEENLDTTEMGSVVAIDGGKTGNITADGALWKTNGLMMGKSSPVVIDGRIYCCDDRAKLHVLDVDTGQTVAPIAKLGTVMRSSLLYADGKIYFCENNGRWYVLRPDPDEGVVTISKGRFPSGEECHASPICSHGKLYIQTTDAMYCLHDPAKQTGITARPPAAQELPPADDQTPAHVQVVPAEMLLQPGQQQQLTVYTYNARGQRLGEASAQFEVTGAGEIQDGVFTVPADAGHTATVVKASVGSLTGLARIRIVPSLPWSFDFEGLSQPPITWVGARYRHVVRSVDGNSVMVKITTIPKGTRSRCWFGPSDLHDYTIEAEVLGAIQDNKTPDIGLIAQGYALDLQGASQRLQIRTWVPQERMARSVDFAWKPNQWYMMKLECSLQGDQAVLRGKVWPKGSEEPAQWTVEATDPSPNLSGSPGLYGNAKDAEILLDNIKVYSNHPAS